MDYANAEMSAYNTNFLFTSLFVGFVADVRKPLMIRISFLIPSGLLILNRFRQLGHIKCIDFALFTRPNCQIQFGFNNLTENQKINSDHQRFSLTS